MENWNWLQIVGLTLLTVGGSVGLICGLALLSSLLSSEYSIPILIILMLIVGACLWVIGKKKGGEE